MTPQLEDRPPAGDASTAVEEADADVGCRGRSADVAEEADGTSGPGGWEAPGVPVLGLGGSDCEALREWWLGQPVNSLSSLAYVVAGAAVARAGGPAAPAVALVTVGLGSVLYHGPMPAWAEVVHDASLVALVAALVHVVWRRRAVRPGALAIIAGMAGITANLLGRTGAPLCRPGSLLQGHAAWHVLTAFACAAWLGRPRADPGAGGPAVVRRGAPITDRARARAPRRSRQEDGSARPAP